MTQEPQPDLLGKGAIVTAASEGLGFACALRLARAGCRVVISARRAPALGDARQRIAEQTGGEVWAMPADLSRRSDIERLVQDAAAHLRGLDILVANTGHVPYGGLEDLPDEAWQDAFDLLLQSAVRLARLAVPLMRAQGGGDIVFITSSIVKEPSPHLLLSSVLRVGVVALAKSLARALASENIRVNTVAPGYFDAGRVRQRLADLVEREHLPRDQAIRQVAGDIPQGRIGDPQELAELVAFLVSRRTPFLTGATIQVDGGSSRGLF